MQTCALQGVFLFFPLVVVDRINIVLASVSAEQLFFIVIWIDPVSMKVSMANADADK